MPVVRVASRTLGFISLNLGRLSGVVVSVLMLVTVIDVLSRSVRGHGILGAVEYSEVLLAVCVFLGLPFAERTGAHVRTSALTAALPWSKARWIFLVGSIGAFVTLLVMSRAVFDKMLASYDRGEVRSGIIDVTLWPVRAFIVLGIVLVTIEFVRVTIHAFRGKSDVGHDPARLPDVAL